MFSANNHGRAVRAASFYLFLPMSDIDLFTSSTDTPRESTTFPHFHDGYAGHAHRAWPAKVEQFVGIIRGGPSSGGPTGDYTDARYFIDRALPKPDSTSTSLLSAIVDSLPGVAQTLTATNLAELPLGSHLLPVGTIVDVFVLYTRSSPGEKVYVFDLKPETAVIVQISSAAGGAGEYSGKILAGIAAASAATDLAMPMGMTVPPADNALILNLEESALAGHRLKNGSYSVGVIRGATADVPPRPIVLIRGALGRTDSPTMLGSTSDTGESAETTTWSRDTDATPVDVYLVSRVVYNPTGDQTLYSFMRKCSFDARGELVSVGAETRVTVDVTEACP